MPESRAECAGGDNEARTIAIRSLSTGAAVLKLHGIVAAGQPGLQVCQVKVRAS